MNDDATRADTSGLLRADDYEEKLGNGAVRIFRGHPGYCPESTRHEPHLFEYEYASGVSGRVKGRYQCKGEPFPFAEQSDDPAPPAAPPPQATP